MKKYHIIYKTTNTINGRIYIGLHSTNKIHDNYLGSGNLLKFAINKYGRKAFTKEILGIYSTRKEARKAEEKLVTPEFVANPNTYNLREGGGGAGKQSGPANHRYGKTGVNAKKLVAFHLDGTTIKSPSIAAMSKEIGIARGNIRNLIKKGIRGKYGWKVSLRQDIV